ncbi:MAG: 50S ribosomal protein L11 methyltransferase [Gemmatimonas sp.]
MSNAPEIGPALSAPVQWQIRLVVPAPAVSAIEEALEPFAFSIASFEDPKTSERTAAAVRPWTVTALAAEKPRLSTITMRLIEVAGRLAIDVPDIAVEPLPALDWLAENRRYFRPQRIGRFFVADPSDVALAPPGAWTIRLAAGPAFGSGTHATTRGCLTSIATLRTRRGRRGLRRVLDLGTGSGILAIAAARAGARRVVASDFDPWAVRTARENARRNGVARRIAAIHATGPAHVVEARGPYDLILANILAAPLRRMMPQLARLLARGGRLVLSGLLDQQEGGVRAAARDHGLVLERRVVNGEWPTLVVRKP